MHPQLTPPDEGLQLTAADARRLLLARALEEGDPQGRFVGAVEREQVDREALAATGDPALGQPLDERGFLLDRTRRLLGLLGHRQPGLAAMQQTPGWLRVVAWGLPLAALALGAAIDRIDNPRQVNLLSPPLLAFLLWNVLVYLLLAAGAVFAWWRPGTSAARMPLAARVGTLGMRRRGGTRGDIVLRFQQAWWTVAGGLEGQRWRSILHASAAAWAIGVALSIVAGGLVREYRIGWESTLLDLPQVHAVLRVLFAPVATVMQVEPFSQAEVARLHFGSGAGVGRVEARRWVVLYVALLALVVVLPRTVLALWAAWRQRVLARRITIDLADPYFAQVLGRVRPARVVLSLPEGAAGPLSMIMRQMAEGPAPTAEGEPWTLLRSGRGDLLQVVAAPVQPTAAPGQPVPAPWWSRGSGASTVARAPLVDLQLLACSDAAALEAALPTIRSAARPVLLVAIDGSESGYAALLRAASVPFEVLPAQALASVRDDARLLAAVRRLAPPYKAPGLERLTAAWQATAARRSQESMRVLAQELVQAARDAEDLAAAPIGVRQLVVRGEREATQEQRRQAHAALLARARQRQAAGDARLLDLHGMAGTPIEAVQGQAIPERFRLEQAIHEPQAGLAGAAGGAAMGAAVDLMTGGLTLGAASALGALIGGGAALVGAAWKNRSTVPGVGTVAMGEEMLLGLAELAVLRYLAVVHQGRTPASALQGWPEAVAATLEGEREALAAIWSRARGGTGEDTAAALVALLHRVVVAVLERLDGPLDVPQGGPEHRTAA